MATFQVVPGCGTSVVRTEPLVISETGVLTSCEAMPPMRETRRVMPSVRHQLFWFSRQARRMAATGRWFSRTTTGTTRVSRITA